jgi:hypothetical protein
MFCQSFLQFVALIEMKKPSILESSFCSASPLRSQKNVPNHIYYRRKGVWLRSNRHEYPVWNEVALRGCIQCRIREAGRL